MAVRLDDMDAVVLRAFRSLDPGGELQFNDWYPALGDALKTEASAAGIETWWRWTQSLRSLVRRGLITADGRGRFRQYGITAKGLEAIADGS